MYSSLHWVRADHPDVRPMVLHDALQDGVSGHRYCRDEEACQGFTVTNPNLDINQIKPVIPYEELLISNIYSDSDHLSGHDQLVVCVGVGVGSTAVCIP